MDTNQLLEGIGAAVAAAKPATNYCLFGFCGVTWWPVCLTKSEWINLLSAFGTFFVGLLALYLPWRQRQNDIKDRIKKEQADSEAKIVAVFEFARESCIGLFNSYRKFYGSESDLHPKTSLERLRSLDRTGQSLISQAYPADLLVPIMRIQREVALAIQATEDNYLSSSDECFVAEADRAARRLINARKERENLRKMLSISISEREHEFEKTHLD